MGTAGKTLVKITIKSLLLEQRSQRAQTRGSLASTIAMGFHQNRKERSRRVSRQTLFCHVPMYTNMKVNGFENLTSLSNITPLKREIDRTYPTLWFCLNTKGCDACDLHESRGSINSDQFILLPTRNCFNQVKVIMINYLPSF